jgi:endonuclease/exonuclease/phosphatase family metal-dependent hydrolase
MALRKRARRSPARIRSEAAGEHDRGLVVATYNIHTCVGVDRRYDPARVAEVLRELDADIVGLQEVDARHRGDRRLDQWVYFAEQTGLVAIPAPNVRDHRGRFGNALLTRWPILELRLLDLSLPGHEPRGAIDVDLVIGNRVLRVIATHFGLRHAERVAQTEKLLTAVREHPSRLNGGRPPDGCLVMGDLNEWRGRRGGVPALDRALGRAPAPRTFPSWCPILPLDRIYAAFPTTLERVAPHRSKLARIASDHLPLRATLCWG